MVCEVVGVRRTDFQPKDGDPISGFSVYVTHGEDQVDGLVAERFFFSDRKIRNDCQGWIPRPGDKFSMTFNRYGKPDEIKPVE